jgi:hypothetical protein
MLYAEYYVLLFRASDSCAIGAFFKFSIVVLNCTCAYFMAAVSHVCPCIAVFVIVSGVLEVF